LGPVISAKIAETGASRHFHPKDPEFLPSSSSSSSSFTQLSCSLVQPFSSVLFFFFFFFFFLVVLLLQPVQLLLSLLCSVRLLFFFLPLLFSVQSGSVCTISDLGRKKERKKEGAVGESTRFINTQRSKSSDEKYEKTMFPFT
jgi:hypothetical protein